MTTRWVHSIYRLIFNQLIEYKFYYIFGVLCLFGTHYLQVKLPFLAKDVADFLSSDPEKINKSFFLLVALGILVFRTGSRLLFFTPARYMERDLRVEIIEKLENTLPTRYQNHSAGQLFQVLFMDMASIRALIGFALLQVGNVVVALSIIIPKLYAFEKQLMMAYLPLLVSVIIFSLITISRQKVFRKIQDAQGDVQNYIIESYHGKKTIQNYYSEGNFIDLFVEYCQKELRFFFKATLGPAFAMPLIPLGVGVSFIWGAHIVQSLDLGASSLVLFGGFVFLLLEPLMFMSWIGAVWMRSIGSWKRISELKSDIDLKTSEEDVIEKYNVEFQLNEIKNIKVPFWSDTGSINLGFIPGSWSVLVGDTGVGKSFILKQIALLLKQKKASLSYVAQEPYLFNDTIQKNIFLGKNPSEDELDRSKKLLELFSLSELTSNIDSLLKLEVGENGKRLSGGQAKRLCLIRSIMGDSEIIIWDDPFSSVDLVLEKQIVQSLKEEKLLENKTIFLTSHRFSTVKYCDHIYYIDKNAGVKEKLVNEELSLKETLINEYFQRQMV